MRAFTLCALLTAAVACQPARQPAKPASFSEAKELSQREGKPILLDFYTESCMPCKQFDKDSREDEDYVTLLATAILLKVDAEKGEGIAMAKEFNAYFYPTFVVANSDGETIDRWSGYGGRASLKRFEDALSDLTTVTEKKARYESNPTVRDAAILGEYNSGKGAYREAVAYYTAAQELNEDESHDYTYFIFENTAYGASGDSSFSFDDVLKAADDAFASKHLNQSTAINFTETLLSLAKKYDLIADIAPYLQAAIEATGDTTNSYYNDYVGRKHVDFELKYIILIEKDEAGAVQTKKAAMPAGWMDDAGRLNNFAWWCFENTVNLKEAEELSSRSIELADDGKQKANCLDTMAEIKNALGDTDAAISLIKNAMAEDPEKEHYKHQLIRFEKILESQPVS